MADAPAVGVVVVNYNSAAFIDEFVRAGTRHATESAVPGEAAVRDNVAEGAKTYSTQ